MNLKYELTKDIKHLSDKITDYENILAKEEVQRQTDLKQFAEKKLEYYKNRLEIASECMKLIYGGVEDGR